MCWDAINIHWSNLKNDRSPFAPHIRSYMHSHVHSHVLGHALNYVLDHALNHVSPYRPFIWSFWISLFIYVSRTSEPFMKSGILKIFFSFSEFLFRFGVSEKPSFWSKFHATADLARENHSKAWGQNIWRTILIEIFITVYDRIRFPGYDDLWKT